MNEPLSERTPPLVLVMACFNEATCLPLMFQELRQRLRPLLGEIGAEWKLLLVDDGSTDQTWNVIQQLSKNTRAVRGIRLSKNMGQQAAILCGYRSVNADWVATLDADLQDPPESIARMLELGKQGNPIVIGHRRVRRMLRMGSDLIFGFQA